MKFIPVDTCSSVLLKLTAMEASFVWMHHDLIIHSIGDEHLFQIFHKDEHATNQLSHLFILLCVWESLNDRHIE